LIPQAEGMKVPSVFFTNYVYTSKEKNRFVKR
jgi:hypothetical protein